MAQTKKRETDRLYEWEPQQEQGYILQANNLTLQNINKIGKNTEAIRIFENPTTGEKIKEYILPTSKKGGIAKYSFKQDLSIKDKHAFDFLVKQPVARMRTQINGKTTADQIEELQMLNTSITGYADYRGFNGVNRKQIAKAELITFAEKAIDGIKYSEKIDEDSEWRGAVRFFEKYKLDRSDKDIFTCIYDISFLREVQNWKHEHDYLLAYRPVAMGAIDENHALAYDIGEKLYDNLNNALLHGAKNGNCISVIKLLEACASLPTYESIKETRQTKQRIIKPFLNMIDYLQLKQIIQNFYFIKKGQTKKYTYAEVENFSYPLFIDLIFHFEPAENYPIHKIKQARYRRQRKIKIAQEKKKQKQE